MNKKIEVLIFLFLISNTFSCQKIEVMENKQTYAKNKQEIFNKSNILMVLEKQLKDGYREEPIDLNDIKALFEIENSLLQSNGYVEPTKEEFEKKINLIFKKEINSSNNFICFDRNKHCYDFNQNTWVNSDEFYIFFSLKNRFITDILWLPEILDYQKEYPKLYKNEAYIENSDVRLWKDIDFLPQQRRFNQQLLISRNKYLFNDDKSQFPWLINNDEYFMENLVTTFGYTEDKKLLKWAFEKQGFTYQIYPPDDILQKFGKFLWTKFCNGEVKIHQNSLNLIKDLSNPSVNQEDYILFVAEYINYLTLEEKITGLTFEQKARIIATLLEFGEQYKYDKAYGFNQMFLGKFIFYQDFDKLYKKEFEKNNYYNLPNLKHWYLLAEKEKDMFVNDMTLSDVPQPRDYLYRATYYTHH
ncbi:hypothetical protein ETU09_09555 [Apibacter muscae]|uniref:Uncharacterized protein n=1 Tax=Apibacter muscae TaxID=2509004 RepID=A0A563D9L5_9FLAO|nr:hypothetical protein [Apibacter muscae]TWP26797.1 hypothetical protein ETU09_09555 [Apibacter muscae]